MKVDPCITLLNPLYDVLNRTDNAASGPVSECKPAKPLKSRVAPTGHPGTMRKLETVRKLQLHSSPEALLKHQIVYGQGITYSSKMRAEYYKKLTKFVEKPEKQQKSAFCSSLEKVSSAAAPGLSIENNQSITRQSLGALSQSPKSVFAFLPDQPHLTGAENFIRFDLPSESYQLKTGVSLDQLLKRINAAQTHGKVRLDLQASLHLLYVAALSDANLMTKPVPTAFGGKACTVVKPIPTSRKHWQGGDSAIGLKAAMDRRPVGTCFTFSLSAMAGTPEEATDETLYCLKVSPTSVVILGRDEVGLQSNNLVPGQVLTSEEFASQALAATETDAQNAGTEPRLTLEAMHRLPALESKTATKPISAAVKV